MLASHTLYTPKLRLSTTPFPYIQPVLAGGVWRTCTFRPQQKANGTGPLLQNDQTPLSQGSVAREMRNWEVKDWQEMEGLSGSQLGALESHGWLAVTW